MNMKGIEAVCQLDKYQSFAEAASDHQPITACRRRDNLPPANVCPGSGPTAPASSCSDAEHNPYGGCLKTGGYSSHEFV